MTDKNPEFSSLEELNNFIEKYEQENYVQLWKRDSKTINRMRSVCPKKLINCNSDLQYYSITYACSKGGKQFKSRSKGVRQSTTNKENCSMKLKVVITEDGQKLKIVNIDDQHNHPTNKDFFEELPKQRRLEKGAKNILSVNCNKDTVCSKAMTVLCRTCLSECKENYISCDSSVIINEQKISISSMLSMCASVQVEPDDRFSQTICEHCNECLQNAYQFRLLAIKTQETMNANKSNYIVSETEVKAKGETNEMEAEDHAESDSQLDEDFDDLENQKDTPKTNSLGKQIVSETEVKAKGETNEMEVEDHAESDSQLHEDFDDLENQKDTPKTNSLGKQIVDPELLRVALDKTVTGSGRRECIICGFESTNLRGLTSHVTHIHKEILHRWCRTCGIEVDNLSDHQSIHSLEKAHKCIFCQKTFSRRRNLVEHLQTHLDEKPFDCQTCKKAFITLRQLKRHQIRYPECLDEESKLQFNKKPSEAKPEFADIKRHTCHFCGQTFAGSSALKRHVTLHTGRPEQCKVCLQRFCRPSELRLHMRKHTGDKPYLCSECGKSFVQSGHLTKHLQKHSDFRPHVCNFCEKGFKDSRVLQDHIRIHTGERPYRCNICDYAGRKRSNLTQHMARHKGDKDNIKELSTNKNDETIIV